MNAITKDRVKLIRGLQSAQNNGFTEPDKEMIASMIILIRSDYHRHFLSLSQEIPGKVTYAAKPEQRFDNDTRMRTTLRRYIRRQLNVSTNEFSDKSLFELGGYIHRETMPDDNLDDRITILKGPEIVDHYRHTGTSSCMTGDDAWKVKIYADNPDKCSLVVLDDHVRALLWKCDDGTIVLDRIYPAGCDAVSILQGWASRKGYAYRLSDGFCDGMISLSDGREHKITLKHNDVFPYFDTFCYGDFNYRDGTITVSNDSEYGDIEFQSTSGGHSDSSYCCSCERTIPEGDVFVAFDNDYCEECFYEHFFYCSNCSNEHRREDLVEVNDSVYCSTCAEALFTRCNDCGQYFEGTGFEVHSSDEVSRVCDECLDNYSECSECGKYFTRNQVLQLDDGKYCLECHANVHQEPAERVVA